MEKARKGIWKSPCGAISLAVLSWVWSTVPGAAAAHPWAWWQRNPITVRTVVGAREIYADTNGWVSVSLSDAQVAQAGAGYDTATNAPNFVANLRVRREYQLTVVTTNATGFAVDLRAVANWSPLTRSSRSVQPKHYYVLVDRAASSGTICVSPPSTDAYTNTWTIELTERLPVNWRQEDGSDDPSFAPGDGGWAQIGPGRSLEASRGAISWSVSLGRLMDGLAAGRLSLREHGISGAIFTPTNLYFTAGWELIRDEVELVPIAPLSPVLRQVKAYQTFVDIVPLTNSTELRFYSPSRIGSQTNEAGYYTNISGSPFVVWTLLNPEPPGTNRLQIIELRNGATRTNEITFDPASTNATWTLTYGTGAEKRVETRGVIISTTGGLTNRTEVEDIRYANAGTAAYHATEVYRLYPWGFELKEVRIPDGESGNELVTVNEYYTDDQDQGNYGKLKQTAHPDGYWEKRIYYDATELYCGILRYVLRPNLDSPSSPDEATLENSVVDNYAWECRNGMVVPYLVQSYLSGCSPFKLQYHYLWEGATSGGNLNESIEGDEVLDYRFVGNWGYTMDESWAFGLALHPIFESDCEHADEASYYHGGSYDMTNKLFVVSTNEIWQGPDWRKSTIYCGLDSARFGPSDPLDSPSVWFSYAEGQPVGDWAVGVDAHTNRAWKGVEIYSGGSLVQRERHVLVGIQDNETNQPVFECLEKFWYQNDSLGRPTNITWIDPVSGVTRVVYSADYKGIGAGDGELKLWEQDEQGVRTTFVYDSLKRTVKTIKEGVAAGGGFGAQAAVTNSATFDAQGRVLTATTASAGLSVAASQTYDAAGRTASQTDTNGLTTTLAYELGGRRVIVTLPSGSTDITENYLDRRVKSRTGTGVVSEYHDWSYDSHYDASSPFVGGSWFVDITHDIGYAAADSPRHRLEGYDSLGRLSAIQNRDWNLEDVVESVYVYGNAGYLKRLSAVWQATRSQTYDHVLRYSFTGRTNVVSSGGAMASFDDLASLYRISRSWQGFAKQGDCWFEVETNVVYRQDNSGEPTVSSINLQRVNGFSSGSVLAETKVIDADTNVTLLTVTVDRAAKKVVQVRDSAASTLNATNITINGLVQLENTPTVAQPVRYGYDSLGRLVSITSPLGFVSSRTYNASGQLASESDFTGLSTVYEYFGNGHAGAGQVSVKTTGGKSGRFDYTARGELFRTWGHVPYPEERVYSDYGELTELHTFRGGSGWNGTSWPASPGTADVTTWTYQPETGLLVGKTDNSGRSVNFTYWQGLLKSRVWARGVGLTNTYNNLGEVIGYEYSDGTASVLFTNLDRTGMPRAIYDAAGTNALVYDHAGRVVSVTGQNGLLAGVVVSNHFNGLNGRDALAVRYSTTPLVQQSFSYDTYGRLGGVASDIYSATYGYLANSDLLESTTCKSNTTAVLTTLRGWEYGSRLRSINNVVNGTVISSHSYQYDPLNRRTRATLEDGSLWVYDYNDRDELTGARRYWPDWAPVSGQHFGYDYDNIGNRKAARSGGDVNGWNLREASYTANGLNQYSSITTPGYKNICGVALATNGVTVNSGGVDRRVEYFHREIGVANENGPLWQEVSVSSGGMTTNGGLVFPGHEQALTYDLDGNLSFDGVWVYEWDGENRLKAMTMTNVAGIANSNRLRLEFLYDCQSRRVQKVVSHWNSGSWVQDADSRFVYDGWNLLAELDTSSSALRTYVWGQDLSGTIDQAGGIGGLVMATICGAPSTNCFAAYDGNGNVMALGNAVSGAMEARYEYSPFGETIRLTGAVANRNPFRFSSKFSDGESGLIYYGFRYYNPVLGRWISRDSAEEGGCRNLYAFVLNRSTGLVDSRGEIAINPAVAAQILTVLILWNASAIVSGNYIAGELDDEMIEWTERTITGRSGAPTPPTGPRSPRIPNPRTINPTKQRIMRWVQKGPFWGRMTGIFLAGVALNGVAASVSQFGTLTQSVADFGGHIVSGENAWADLDAATFAAQLQSAGSDYFFTMAMLDSLLMLSDSQ